MSEDDKVNTSNKKVNRNGTKQGLHPNSLAALKPIPYTSERAKESQQLSTISRIRNREKREFVKLFAKELREGSMSIEEDLPSGLQVLNILMLQALQEGDNETAAKHAATLAEYQAAKVTRQEITQTSVNLSDMSDEELKEYEELMSRNKDTE